MITNNFEPHRYIIRGDLNDQTAGVLHFCVHTWHHTSQHLPSLLILCGGIRQQAVDFAAVQEESSQGYHDIIYNEHLSKDDDD